MFISPLLPTAIIIYYWLFTAQYAIITVITHQRQFFYLPINRFPTIIIITNNMIVTVIVVITFFIFQNPLLCLLLLF